jgi:Zn-dependent protease with chaperone function
VDPPSLPSIQLMPEGYDDPDAAPAGAPAPAAADTPPPAKQERTLTPTPAGAEEADLLADAPDHVVPVADAAPEEKPLPSAEEVLAALDGEFAAPSVPLLYRFGTVAAGMVLILLFSIYLLLIAAGVGVTVFSLYHFTSMTGNVGAILRYIFLVPAGIAAVVTLFMFKPLFAPRPLQAAPYAVDREQEPQLFAYVERLCTLVGAPNPTRIEFYCDVNAAVYFRRGLLSLFGNDIVLTIGLPLMLGTDLRQFTGVLAHELGHFAQGAGMRISYLVRVLSSWFIRVVHERDALDVMLAELGEKRRVFRPLVATTSFFITIPRMVLHGLMHVGLFVSSFLLRQMEYDADQYEAGIAGSTTFAETSGTPADAWSRVLHVDAGHQQGAVRADAGR